MSEQRTSKIRTQVVHAGGQSPAALGAEASRVLGKVCEALAGVLESLPGQPSRAVDVARVLKVHAPLAWQAFKMAGTTEPLAAVKYLPTSNQLSRLIQAADDAGAGKGAVATARRAATDLDGFMSAHARDRREFESLMCSLSRDAGGGSQIDMKHRRLLVRSNSHVWGIQARTGYAAMIVHENEAGAGTTVMIGGYVGLHVLRADVPMSCAVRTGVRSPSQVVEGAEPTEGRVIKPAAPMAPMGETRLIPPLPGAAVGGTDKGLRLVTSGHEDGEAVSMIRFPGIGRRAAVSFFLEQAYESAAGRAAQDGHSLASQVRVPSETLVLDLLVPSAAEGQEPFGAARVTTYGRRQGVDRVWERRAIDVLPTNEQASSVRGVVDVPPTQDVPRVPEIIRHVLKERGWYGEKFDLFRCRVEYPILHALVCMNVERESGKGKKRKGG
jgi:hypothetical protein